MSVSGYFDDIRSTLKLTSDRPNHLYYHPHVHLWISEFDAVWVVWPVQPHFWVGEKDRQEAFCCYAWGEIGLDHSSRNLHKCDGYPRIYIGAGKEWLSLGQAALQEVMELLVGKTMLVWHG